MNPFLPLWEYIPDGEPRVFGNRVYIYGSHDSHNGMEFCDYKLKVWSASIHDLCHWVCHGHIFHTRPDTDHPADVPYTENRLFAPDVVKKGDKYYLYTYIHGAKGCVSVSDRPEGPFKFLSKYDYAPGDGGDDGIYNDIGVLVDDDGKVYCYYGFCDSNMNELDPKSMYKVIKGSLRKPVIPDAEGVPEDRRFYEASSPRKIGNTYYLIYSPHKGSRLAYATSDAPTGPFTYRGYIVDNGEDYPAGNNHGSIAQINGQWYVFYHRMTNNSIMSRRACVEKITILPDGTISPVEMTSLGFEEALNPYAPTPAETACVLTGGCFVTEKDVFRREVTNVTDGCVLGYKYFDFGEDFATKTMEFAVKISGTGRNGKFHIMLDAPTTEAGGKEIGAVEIGLNDGTYRTRVENVTGRHAVYLRAEASTPPREWMNKFFVGRSIADIEEFVFLK